MTIMLFDFVIVAMAAALGALLMHWHYDGVRRAISAERKNTERYRADAEGLRLAAARRDVPLPRDWPEPKWSILPSLTEQAVPPELALDENDEAELKEHGAVVKMRRSGRETKNGK